MKNERSKKIKTGDSVKVIAGDSKGMIGKVIACRDNKVIVEGVNVCKKHVKKSQQHPSGGVVEFEKPVDVSNVCACDSEGNCVKLSVVCKDDGARDLCYMKDGQSVVFRSVKRKR